MLSNRRNRLFMSGLLVLLAVLLASPLWVRTGGRDYSADPTLIAAKGQDRADLIARMKGGPAFVTRLWKYYYHFVPPPSGTWSFPIETNRCSIHGILNQCCDGSGVPIFIDKDVAGGSVVFGTSVVLNGPQWVSAFTNGLQTGLPGWWDNTKRKFRTENLAIIPADRGGFLVLPKDRVREYQKSR
jgi:hypothetical protein